MLNRAWKRRQWRDTQWREQANRNQRAWAMGYPFYWRGYRREHPNYVVRDNQRRARALRRQRWGCSAKD